MMGLYLIVGLLVTIAVAALLYGVSRISQPDSVVEQRVEAWVSSRQSDAASTGAGGRRSGLLGGLDESLARQGFAEQIATDLARADLALTVGEYLLIRVALVLGGFLLTFLLRADVISALIVGALAYFVPLVYVKFRQTQRLRAFNDQLPDVLDHLVGSLRAGYGLLQAVEWVGRQVADPAGYEFNRIVREVQLGRSLTDAFDSAVRRLNSDDLALIVTAIKIQYEVGGNLSEILDTVAFTIRERVRIEREISVLTAQQRYSGYVLMLLPIALAVVLYLLNPEYERQLFTPGPTLCIPIGTAIMMIVGFFVMRRIVDIEV